MTADAITGPAKQPLPTSSTPAISFKAKEFQAQTLLGLVLLISL
jgi:hypothetical protein